MMAGPLVRGIVLHVGSRPSSSTTNVKKRTQLVVCIWAWPTTSAGVISALISARDKDEMRSHPDRGPRHLLDTAIALSRRPKINASCAWIHPLSIVFQLRFLNGFLLRDGWTGNACT